MKTLKKLSILIAVIIIIVTSLVIWKKTSLTPPNNMEYENEHLSDLMETVGDVLSEDFESYYQECTYKLRRYANEQLIDDQNLSSIQVEFLDNYVPIFLKECEKRFIDSKWNKKPWNHDFMRTRISDLKYRDKQYNDNLYADDMDKIITIIDNYDDAMNLSTKTRYKSIDITDQRVKKSREYLNDTILDNCSELVEKLRALPGKIRKSHLAYLNDRVNNLTCKDIMSFDKYNKSLLSLYNEEIVNGYDSYYNNSADTKNAKKKLLDREYNYLNEYVNYVTNIDNFINYEIYKSYNELVMGYLTDLCLNKDLNASVVTPLYNKLESGFLKEEVFYERKQEKTEQEEYDWNNFNRRKN